MMLPDLTVRNECGSADMVPYRRRDDKESSVRLEDVPDWERRPAALELYRSGWHIERIASATGLEKDAIRGIVDPGRLQQARSRALAAVDAAIALYQEQRDQERRRAEAYQRKLDQQRAYRQARMAERVKVNGRWIHPRARHGTPYGYASFYCRCGPCSRAHTEERAATRARTGRR